VRRKQVRLRKTRRAERYRRALERLKMEPRLLFIQRAALREPVAIEWRRLPLGFSGFWRFPTDGRRSQFYRVRKIVETRREHDASYFRIITDAGCFDLRRYRSLEPWTMKPSARWELTAELEAVEITHPF
jgi:hypothetical protein